MQPCGGLRRAAHRGEIRADTPDPGRALTGKDMMRTRSESSFQGCDEDLSRSESSFLRRTRRGRAGLVRVRSWEWSAGLGMGAAGETPEDVWRRVIGPPVAAQLSVLHEKVRAVGALAFKGTRGLRQRRRALNLWSKGSS